MTQNFVFPEKPHSNSAVNMLSYIRQMQTNLLTSMSTTGRFLNTFPKYTKIQVDTLQQCAQEFLIFSGFFGSPIVQGKLSTY